MQNKHVEVEERELTRHPLSRAELERLIGKRDPVEFLNPRNSLYRKMNLKARAPSRKQALDLMVKEPNLIRRPILKSGRKLILGADLKAIAEL